MNSGAATCDGRAPGFPHPAAISVLQQPETSTEGEISHGEGKSPSPETARMAE